MDEEFILSKAHDWRGDKSVVCIRCRAETEIGKWDMDRCIPHYESAKSGYRDES